MRRSRAADSMESKEPVDGGFLPPDVVQLFESMCDVEPYPSGTQPVTTQLCGTAFFPGGAGLWREEPTDELPKMPHRGIMVVGQDFGTMATFLRLIPRGGEAESPTWRPLRVLLSKAGIRLDECFFTNAWMGLRSSGPETGPYVGARDKRFTGRCANFLALQIAVQRPRLIVSLGTYVPPFLSKLSPQLEAWTPWGKFATIDSSNAGLVRKAMFPSAGNIAASVTALVHPCYRHVNVKGRRFTDRTGCTHVGDDAEVAMLIEGSAVATCD